MKASDFSTNPAPEPRSGAVPGEQCVPDTFGTAQTVECPVCSALVGEQCYWVRGGWPPAVQRSDLSHVERVRLGMLSKGPA